MSGALIPVDGGGGAPARAREALKDSIVVITGPTGSGKTSLALAMMATVPGAARISNFDGPELANGDPREPGAAVWAARTAPTLLLDLDLVKVPRLDHDTDDVRVWWEDQAAELSEVIRERQERFQQTIVTMAVGRDVFARGFGSLVASIVFGGTVIELDWSYDWRVTSSQVEEC